MTLVEYVARNRLQGMTFIRQAFKMVNQKNNQSKG
ncbi:hypothetical protein Vpro01_01889 [Vibrio proteolyticus]